MPKMDGLQLANQVRKLKNIGELKLVMISAEENIFNNFDNMFDEIYVKPISTKKIVQIYNE